MTDPSHDPLERALAGLTAPEVSRSELWRTALARTPTTAPRSYLSAPVLAASGVSLAVLITLVTVQPFPGPSQPAGGSLAAATGPAMTPAGERNAGAGGADRDDQFAADSRQRAQKTELAERRLAQPTPAPAAAAKQSASQAPAEAKKDGPAADRADALSKETAQSPPATATTLGRANNEPADTALALRDESSASDAAAPAQESPHPASAPPDSPTLPSPITPALPRTIGATGWFYSAAIAGLPLWIALLVITIQRRRAAVRAALFARPEPPPVV